MALPSDGLAVPRADRGVSLAAGLKGGGLQEAWRWAPHVPR